MIFLGGSLNILGGISKNQSPSVVIPTSCTAQKEVPHQTPYRRFLCVFPGGFAKSYYGHHGFAKGEHGPGRVANWNVFEGYFLVFTASKQRSFPKFPNKIEGHLGSR